MNVIRRLGATGLLLALLALPAAFSLARPPVRPEPVEAGLWQTMLAQGEADFLVILDRQADLRGAARLQGKEAKGAFVVDALRAVAAETQPALVARLEARGARVRPFYVVNALLVRGDLGALQAAAEGPHVARIVADAPVRLALPPVETAPAAQATAEIPWGVSRVNAPQVWALETGFTGRGIVIGNQDTGVFWEHNALKGHYRGWNGVTADHDYHWHDAIHTDLSGDGGNPCGFDSPAPCDDQGHGTHTVGTAVGSDGGSNQIGVAPGATWIACRNMDSGIGRPSSYLECFEWFLAPYPVGGSPAPLGGDPARAPHILSNSWSCPPFEQCLTGQEIISGVQAMRAAGILTVVAAGNSGSGCATIDVPPAMYAESFTVGASAENGAIAPFSSRGPVTRDGSNRLKPDLAAPGVAVRSSLSGAVDKYGTSSGTSMATPHVAGVAALLWEAAPYLVGEVDLTEWVLRLSANPRPPGQSCGGDGPAQVPNNVWGWGAVDALAAVSATRSLTPTAALAAAAGSIVAGIPTTLDASPSSDPETPDTLLARWDFDGDGLWDTAWWPALTTTVTFSQTGLQTVTVQVADPGGRTDAATRAFQVGEPWRLYLPTIRKP